MENEKKKKKLNLYLFLYISFDWSIWSVESGKFFMEIYEILNGVVS